MSSAPQPRTTPELDFAPLGHLAANTGGRTIDIVQFTLALWKPLAVGFGGGVLLGLLAYLYLGPTYQADTRILVSEKSSVSSRPNTTNLVGDRGEHISLILSDAIVHRALTTHGLGELPAYKDSDDPIESILDALQVSRSAGRETSKDNVFNISFSHPDPQTAKLVVEAIVASYRDFLEDRQKSNVSDLTRTLQQREQELRAEIRRLEQDHYKWRDGAPPISRSTPVVTSTGAAMVMPNRWEQELDNVSKKLSDNLAAQQVAKARLTALEEMLAAKKPRDVIEFWVMHSLSSGGGEGGQGGGGSGMLSGPPGKGELDSRLLTARMLETKLLFLVGPDHDEARKVRREIEAILAFYKQQGMTPPRLDPLPGDQPASKTLLPGSPVDLPTIYGETLQSELEYLAIQEQSLRGQVTEAEKKAKEAALYEMEDQRRKDEIAEKKKELAAVTTDMAAFKQSKDSEGYTVTPIAQVRVSKSLKRVLKLVGLFSVFGVCAVFGLAYFREWYDSTVHTQDEVRRSLNLPLLGAVPHFRAGPNDRQLEASTGVSAALCYYHRPGSREAESFRSVRTTLFSATKESGDKVIQVSSAEPGDGKTTSTCNLAVAIAQSGKRVLLIDADLRRPTVHLLLGLRGDVGLSNVLRREVEWETVVQSTRIDGLSVLPSGPCPENPAELLSVATLGQLLRQVRTDFDYLLVDSPPVLAVSDPCIISPHVDGMLLVVRMQKNKRAALVHTREVLETHGVSLYGVVVNDFAMDVEGYGSDSYHEYYRPADSIGSPTPSHVGARAESRV